MHHSLAKAAATIVLLALPLPVAAACQSRMPAEAQRQVVPAGRINLGLMDAAVLAEVNLARCKAGLRALRPAGAALARAAEAHSRWMVSAGNLTHRSNVSGRSSPAERIRAAGIRLRAGSENIGYISRYQIDGGPFRIVDAGNCRFATHGGQSLPAHTYASAARHVVASWMRSPGHRRNILDRRVDRLSSAAAYDARGPYCGRLWFTQNFVG